MDSVIAPSIASEPSMKDQAQPKREFQRTVPMMLNRTLEAVMPPYRALFSQFELTEQQWRVLRILWECGPVSAAEISRRSLISTSSLVGVIDRLENRSLVLRTRSETDRRQTVISATEEGRALEEAVRPHVADLSENLNQRLTQQEWDTLETLLTKLADAKTAYDGDLS